MTTELQNHHIIPQELFNDDFLFLQDIPDFKDSQKFNLMGLPTSLNGNFTMHLGSHPQYTDWIRDQIALIDDEGGTLAEKQAKLIGLTNVMKTKFAEPGFLNTLNGLGDGAIYNELSGALSYDGPDGYRNSGAFRLGELADGALTAAQNGDWKIFVDGDSALNAFNFGKLTATEQQARLDRLNNALDAILPEVDTALRNPAMKDQAARDAARAIDGMVFGNLSEADARATLRGERAFTTYTGPDGRTSVLFSSSLASGLGLKLLDLGQGSTIVDAVSLTLIGHGLVQMGAFPTGLGLTGMVRALANSNIVPQALSLLDNLAIEIGKEVAVSAIATMLGVGLLWKGYEIYQSIDGLTGALEFASQADPNNQTLQKLNNAVATIESWFGGQSDPNYVPEYMEMARLVETAFEETPETIDLIVEAIEQYLYKNGWVSWNVGQGDIEGALYQLQLLVGSTPDADTLGDAIEAALYDSGKLSPQVLYALDPTRCFPAGTPITMWDGRRVAIEDVRAGDLVLSFDAAGHACPGQVTRLFTQETREWVRLDFPDGGVMHATPGHRFRTETGGYAQIGHLVQLGSGTVRVVREDGIAETVTGTRVHYCEDTAGDFEAAAEMRAAIGVAGTPGGWRTYNFEVARHHNYVAAGVRVHNESVFAFLSPAEAMLVTEIRDVDGDSKPDFAVIRLPGTTTEIQKTLQGNTAISEITTSDGMGNVIYYRIVEDENGNIIARTDPTYIKGQFIGQAVGQALTPFLTQAILGEDASPFEQIAANTVFDTLLGNVGETIGALIGRANINYGEFSLGAHVETIAGATFEDFGGELIANGINNVASAINQLIMAEIFEFIDADGIPGAIYEAVIGAGVGAVVGQGVEWLVNSDGFASLFGSNTQLLEQVRSGVSISTLPDGFDGASGWASLILGAVVREILPDLETVEGQIGSAVTGAILATTGALTALGAFAGPVGAVISWAIGALIDLLFDKDPQAWTSVGFNEVTGRFQLTGTWSDDGGDTELSEALAQAYVNGMNGFIDVMKAESHNYGELAQWSFGHYEESLKNAGRHGQTFKDFQDTYLDAYIRDLAQVRLDDGQMTAVRALNNLNLDIIISNSIAESSDETRIFYEIEVTNVDGTKSVRVLEAGSEVELTLADGSVLTVVVEDDNLPAEIAILRQVVVAPGDVHSYDGKHPLEIYQMIAAALQIATDYHTYLENSEAINALIAADPETPFAAGWYATIAEAVRLGLAASYDLTGTGIDNVFYTAEDNDTVLGEGGDDFIKTYHGDDSVDGGEGDDTIYAGAGADTVTGGEGEDWIDAGAGDDLVHGGTGDDSILGSSGADLILGEAGADSIDGGSGADTIDGGDGADWAVFLSATSGVKVELLNGRGVAGDAAGDIYISIENLRGSNHVDHLTGDEEVNIIQGQGGNDTIVALGGDDTLEGNDGDDSLLGGGGIDTYFGGAGFDIVSYETSTSAVIASLETGTTQLWEYYNGTYGYTEIMTGIEGLTGSAFDDRLTGNTSVNRIEGGRGNDTIYGGRGADTYVYSAGDGSDYIVDYAQSGDQDTDRLEFTDLLASEVSFAADAGENLIIRVADGKSITIENHFTQSGRNAFEEIAFADGTVLTFQEILAKSAEDQKARGHVFGTRLADTYTHELGDGSYIIEDSGNTGGVDRLNFIGLNANDVQFARGTGNALVIFVAGTETITILGYFNSNGSGVIEEIAFADGTIMDLAAVTTRANADTASVISWGNGEDTLNSLQGADSMTGGDGSDTYVFARGDGQDVIEDNGFNDTDVLLIQGYSPDEVILRPSVAQGGNLIINFVGTTDSIRITNTLQDGYYDRIEEIHFEDGTVWNFSQIIAKMISDQATDGHDLISATEQSDTLYGGLGDDTLHGGDGSDTYIFERGDGQDVIEDNGFNDTDILLIRGYLPEEVILLPQTPESAHLVLTFTGTNDRIVIRNTLTDGYYDRIEEIRFEDGTVWNFSQIIDAMVRDQATVANDVISASNEADTLYGDLGNDTIYGGDGSDTYIFERGDGQDVIEDNGFNDTDVLLIRGYTPSEAILLPLSPESSHLVLTFTGTDDRILIRNTLTDGYYDRIEEIHFEDGTVWNFSQIVDEMVRDQATSGDDIVSASNEADTLYGNLGNDTLHGGDGSDTYIFARGDGQDVIEDNGFNDTDVLLIRGYTPSEVILLPQSPQSSHLVLTFVGTDDQILIRNTLTDSYYDRIEQIRFEDGTTWSFSQIVDEMVRDQATSGDDTISVSSEADTLYGNLGNDTLHGGDGSDTYIFARGDGQDVIDDNGFNDTDVLLIRNYTPEEVILRPESPGSSNLVLTFVGTEDRIVILNTLTDSYYDRIEQISFEDGTVWNFAQIIAEMIRDQATAGNDVISGSGEADTLYGGLGNDTLHGGDGSDTYVFARGDGQDVIDDNGAGDTDILLLQDYSPEEVVLRSSENGSDLIVSFITSTDQVLIRNTIPNSHSDRIEQIHFEDGTVWNSTFIYQRLLDGSPLDDLIKGYSEADEISGLGGNDTLLGEGGNDTLDGGDGDDVLNGGSGNDILIGGEGNDLIQASSGVDSIYGGAGEDTFDLSSMSNAWTVDLSAEIYTRDGATGHLVDIEHVRAGSGHDTLIGNAEANQLNGNAGHDILLGLGGNDTLSGGTGNDTIDGGEGDDLIVFTAGDGRDRVVDSGTGSNDVLRLVGLDPAVAIIDLLTTDRTGLSITFEGNTDEIVLSGVLGADPATGIDRIEFDDGTIWDRAWLMNYVETNLLVVSHDEIFGTSGADILMGRLGDDTLSGGNGADTYIYDRGHGHDTIIEGANGGSNDELVLFDLNPADATLVRSGNDLTVVIAESAPDAGDAGSILIKNTLNDHYDEGLERVSFADGTIWTRADLRELLLAQESTAGNDSIIGYNTNDTITGGHGDDVLDGGLGNDTYRYVRGDGHDTITEGANSGASDQLVLAGIAPSDVSLQRNGNDLTLVIAESGAGDGGSILIRNTLNEYFNQGLETISFDDGTIWTRADLRNMLLTSTSANETLNGFSGNDTFRYSRGGGSDTIIEDTNSGSNDQLILTDITPTEVTLQRNGNDLTIVIGESAPGAGDGGTILIRNTLDNYQSQGIERVVFSNGTAWTRAEIIQMLVTAAGLPGNDTITGTSANDILQGGLGNDSLNGAGGNDTYLYARGDGHDTITEGTNNGADDRLQLTDINPGEVTLLRSGLDVTIVISESAPGAGDDGSILIKTTLDDYYSRGVENIIFADGAVWTRADLRDMLLRNTSANETFNGFAGNDTFNYGRGDGHDIIVEGTNSGSNDQLVLTGIAVSDVTLTYSGNDLTLVIAESSIGAGDGGSILIKNTLNDYYSQGVERIVFPDGTTWTRADLRDMLLTSTASDETFTGFSGNDTFRYDRGDGHDTIIEGTNSGSNDQLLLTGIAVSDVTLARSGNDLTLIIAESAPEAGDGGSILIRNTLNDYYSQGVERIVFPDGTTWTRAQLRDMLLTSTAANDILNGFSGNDTFRYTRGDGHDTIVEGTNSGSNDQLVLTGIAVSEVTLVRSGNDLTLVIAESAPGAGDNGSILMKDTLRDYYSQGVEKIVFPDGTIWTQADLRDMLLTSTAANDTLNGFSGNDIFRYARGSGHDTIVEGTNSGSNDQLLLTDITSDEVTLVRSGNDLTLVIAESSPGAGDSGSILIKNTIEEYYNQGLERIVFADNVTWTRSDFRTLILEQAATDGDDLIFGFDAADTISGGLGNDTLNGGTGNDTYLYSLGDGNDTIVDYTYGGSNDVLIFNDVASTSVTVRRLGSDPNDVVITMSNGEHVTLQDQLIANNRYGVEQIVFADDVTWTRANLTSAPIVDDELVYI